MPMASGAATIAPTELPVKRRPKPTERCSRGRMRFIVCAAPGNDGASAVPSKIRIPMSTAKDGTSACAAATTDHASTASTSPRRARAVRSQRRTGERRPDEVGQRERRQHGPVLLVPEMCSASRTVGASAASVCRSM